MNFTDLVIATMLITENEIEEFIKNQLAGRGHFYVVTR